MRQVYYLSSLDSYALEATRRCEFLELMQFATGKQCVLAAVDPPLPGEPFGVSGEISRVILANRHRGETLSPIVTFPCFVFVARPLDPDQRRSWRAQDMQILAFGELYRSQQDIMNFMRLHQIR
jgi:hypothetical protein